MDLTLVKYNTKHMNNKEKVSFSRKFFGYEDKSNNGQYTYKRKGTLSDYVYDKIAKSAFFTETRHEDKIIKELHKYKIPVQLIRLVLKK